MNRAGSDPPPAGGGDGEYRFAVPDRGGACGGRGGAAPVPRAARAPPDGRGLSP